MSKKNKKSSGKKVKQAKKTTPKKAAKKTVVKKTSRQVGTKKTVAKKKIAPKKSSAPAVKSKAKAKAKPVVKTKKTAPAPKAPIAKKPARTVVAPEKDKKIKPAPAAKTIKPETKKSEPAKTVEPPKQKTASAPAAAKNLPGLKSLSKPAPILDDGKAANDPPGKFVLEYVVHSSAELLFNFLTEPSGLSEWFCDDVNIRHGIYTFFWDGSQQQAKEIRLIPEKLVRFQWMDKNDGTYFEFRIDKDELTGDISLMITDFADTPEERNSSKLLWDSQIDKLLHVMGAYF